MKLQNREGIFDTSQLWGKGRLCFLIRADVSILEMGIMASEGYEDQLTVAYISMMSHANLPSQSCPETGWLQRQARYQGNPSGRRQ